MADSKTVSTRLHLKDLHDLEQLAEYFDRTESWLIRRAIQDFLKRELAGLEASKLRQESDRPF